MATVLSRALKLPGKKSPDLGEYDPLTQADSDESEDDLVLNLKQKNGGVKNGKSPQGEGPDPDSDAEGIGPAKQHLSEVTTEGYPSPPLGNLEQKTASSFVSHIRTLIFLLTVLISMILVLVCAFLIPCPPRDLQNMWSRHLGPEGGGNLSPLELVDVNGDGLPDVLLSFVNLKNESMIGVPKPQATLLALSGVNGSTLWTSSLAEEAQSLQCSGLTLVDSAEAICLVTGISKLLSALNATSGKAIWTLNPSHLSSGTLAAPAVLLPDLDDDGVRDLMILTTGLLQGDLCFLLVSGKTGIPMGRPVKYNIVREGNLIGPQVHITTHGAIYILFGFGNIQAIALKDIFIQAENRDSSPPSLQIEEPEWEKRRSVNLSELIDVYSDGVEFLQMVKAPDSNCSNLLITTTQGLVLLRGQDLERHWVLNLQGLCSQPTLGYFTNDQTLDFLLEAQYGNGMKKVIVVDGNSGVIIWNNSLPCHMKESAATSVMTSDQKSVFLFWAEGLSASPSDSDLNSEPELPGLHHLYLLHPTFPTLLLDLANDTGTVNASAIGINDVWKDAFYVIRKTGPGSENHPRPLVVSKVNLRWALMESQVVLLKETTPKIGRGELRRFLSRIKFVSSQKV
ncbi:protein FAM234B [Sarcophilus harrisii]|uniref:Family with sequence similarity 234 member B n=1 Tax=Sarcophilus harrisii TaxID=9305 RepID=G3W602_SARHA|nr:protein FAM234B [Sarcophilus harrisii]